MTLDLVRPAVGEPIEPLLTAEQVAQALAVRVKRVYELGIPCVRLSPRAIRWHRADVLAWLERSRAA